METTKRGKATKGRAMADRDGLPLTVPIAAASLPEVPLVEPTLTACVVDSRPAPLLGDKADESDLLDACLAAQGPRPLLCSYSGEPIWPTRLRLPAALAADRGAPGDYEGRDRHGEHIRWR